MLPNFKFLVCGILFCLLLFAVAGTVMLPDSRTRVGEMPEVGRPLMQRSMADAPAQAQIYMMAAARRNDELERLRQPAPVEAAPEQPAPDSASIVIPELPKLDLPASGPAVSDAPQPDVGPDAAPTPGDPAVDAAPEQSGIVSVPPTHRPAAPPPAVQSESDDPPSGGPAPLVAALASPAAEEDAPAPIFTNVPLPARRPAVFNGSRRLLRIFHRRHRIAPQFGASTPATPAVQAAPAGQIPGAASQGFAAGYPTRGEAGR